MSDEKARKEEERMMRLFGFNNKGGTPKFQTPNVQAKQTNQTFQKIQEDKMKKLQDEEIKRKKDEEIKKKRDEEEQKKKDKILQEQKRKIEERRTLEQQAREANNANNNNTYKSNNDDNNDQMDTRVEGLKENERSREEQRMRRILGIKELQFTDNTPQRSTPALAPSPSQTSVSASSPQPYHAKDDLTVAMQKDAEKQELLKKESKRLANLMELNVEQKSQSRETSKTEKTNTAEPEMDEETLKEQQRMMRQLNLPASAFRANQKAASKPQIQQESSSSSSSISPYHAKDDLTKRLESMGALPQTKKSSPSSDSSSSSGAPSVSIVEDSDSEETLSQQKEYPDVRFGLEIWNELNILRTQPAVYLRRLQQLRRLYFLRELHSSALSAILIEKYQACLPKDGLPFVDDVILALQDYIQTQSQNINNQGHLKQNQSLMHHSNDDVIHFSKEFTKGCEQLLKNKQQDEDYAINDISSKFLYRYAEFSAFQCELIEGVKRPKEVIMRLLLKQEPQRKGRAPLVLEAVQYHSIGIAVGVCPWKPPRMCLLAFVSDLKLRKEPLADEYERTRSDLAEADQEYIVTTKSLGVHDKKKVELFKNGKSFIIKMNKNLIKEEFKLHLPVFVPASNVSAFWKSDGGYLEIKLKKYNPNDDSISNNNNNSNNEDKEEIVEIILNKGNNDEIEEMEIKLEQEEKYFLFKVLPFKYEAKIKIELREKGRVVAFLSKFENPEKKQMEISGEKIKIPLEYDCVKSEDISVVKDDKFGGICVRAKKRAAISSSDLEANEPETQIVIH